VHSIKIPPPGKTVTLSPERRRHFWLMFKEIVTNIAKHARCSQVWIQLEVLDDCIRLGVADNGIGFDAGKPSTGQGLRNIEARAQQLGATITLETSSGSGTRWDITFSV
jgi:signal transduction histidine kinase